MESFYIGPPGARLYCNLHRPKTRLIRGTGVLLCPPIGHEYYRTYRAFSRLAEQLSDTGYTVIRFDYLGTGDSEGSTTHERIHGWANDVCRCAGRLLEIETVDSLALVGMRAGAINAAMAAGTLDKVRALIMWEPTIPGDRYVDGLSRLHNQLLKDLERFPFRRDSSDSLFSEYVGHIYGRSLLEDLRTLDPTESIPDAIEPILLCSAETEKECGEAVTASGRNVLHYRLQHGGYGWREIKRVSETVVDPIANRQLTEILDRAAA